RHILRRGRHKPRPNALVANGGTRAAGSRQTSGVHRQFLTVTQDLLDRSTYVDTEPTNSGIAESASPKRPFNGRLMAADARNLLTTIKLRMPRTP
ncbi:MAG TPA: hypothetical protein VIN35_04110, partial [Hydrogenophaga sp.]